MSLNTVLIRELRILVVNRIFYCFPHIGSRISGRTKNQLEREIGLALIAI
ncbi:unnamed protein product [Brassica oleracea]